MTVSTSAVVAYNDIQWGPYTKTRLGCKPVYDSANRMVKYVQYDLYVDGWIVGNTTDSSLLSMRQKLTAPGKALTYQSNGSGDLLVNQPTIGTPQDVAFGPKPELLSLRPVGNTQAWYTEWKVSTCIPECSAALYRGLTEYAFSVDWDINTDGLTVRTINVFAEIASNFMGNGILDQADVLRESITPAIPQGYQRTSQHFQLAKDQRSLTASFTDTQLLFPLPPGCTRVDARLRVSSRLQGDGFRRWPANLSGHVFTAPSVPKDAAFNMILLIMKSRMEQTGLVAIPMEMSFEESLFTNQTSFSLTTVYISQERPANGQTLTTLAIDVNLTKILQSLRVWREVPGTDFTTWATSLADVSGARGHAGMQFNASDVVLLSLCQPGSPDTTNQTVLRTGEPPGTGAVLRGGGVLGGGGTIAGGSADLVPPGIDGGVVGGGIGAGLVAGAYALDGFGGYIYYLPKVQLYVDDGLARHKPIPPAGAAFAPDILQQVHSPSVTLRLTGQAIRWGMRVPTPALQSVAGVALREASRFYEEGVVGGFGGVPLYGATWDIEYIPAGPLPSLPLAPNPTQSGGFVSLSTNALFATVDPDQLPQDQPQQVVLRGGGVIP